MPLKQMNVELAKKNLIAAKNDAMNTYNALQQAIQRGELNGADTLLKRVDCAIHDLEDVSLTLNLAQKR